MPESSGRRGDLVAPRKTLTVTPASAVLAESGPDSPAALVNAVVGACAEALYQEALGYEDRERYEPLERLAEQIRKAGAERGVEWLREHRINREARKPATPGIRAELAAAVRKVNAIYGHIPESAWPDVDGDAWEQLEQEIDAASAADDRDRALAAIRRWEDHARSALLGEAAT